MDGSTAATQWKGLHDVSETVHSYNPNGWLQTVIPPLCIRYPDYPFYMAPDGEF
jgi:hypothetical protein